jgi:hypothetical protein
MATTFKLGCHYRVKSTPWAKADGLRVSSQDNNATDCKVWPGEVGRAVAVAYTAWDGSPQVSEQLQFSRDRYTTLAEADRNDFVVLK